MTKTALRQMFLSLLVLLFSCNPKPVIVDTKLLAEYYKAENIQANIEGRNAILIVTNSKTIEQALANHGLKWKTQEPFASIGAFLLVDEIDTLNIPVDTIVVTVVSKSSTKTFKYAASEVRQIESFLENARKFMFAWEKSDAVTMHSLAGKAIQEQFPDPKGLEKALEPVSFGSKITDAELLAYKIGDGIAALYINAKSADTLLQTYILNYKVSEDDRVDGIETPKVGD